jgi:hypothetical protein
MIVELANIISSQAECIKELTHQSTLFPAPATEEETISLGEGVSTIQQLTFPMDP